MLEVFGSLFKFTVRIKCSWLDSRASYGKHRITYGPQEQYSIIDRDISIRRFSAVHADSDNV